MSDISEDFPSSRVKLLCSYAGKILPRPSDGRLRYVGGEKRIITINRDITFSELMLKMLEVYGLTVSMKYQLPNEDLDALVSVCSDEDLENMMDEHDSRDGYSRIRVFLFSSADYDLDHFSDSSGDHRSSEQLYLDAINGVLDSGSTKNSGSAVSDVAQDLENLVGGIDLGDTWSASSMEDTLPAQITARIAQSAVPFDQLLPVSLFDALPTDEIAKSETPPCKPSTFPVVPTTILQETGNGIIYPATLSLEPSASKVNVAGSAELSATITQLVDSSSKIVHGPVNPGAETVSTIQNDLVSVFPIAGSNVVSSEGLHMNDGSTQNHISGLLLFPEPVRAEDELKKFVSVQHQVTPNGTSTPMSSFFTGDTQENLAKQDQQADQFNAHTGELSTVNRNGPTMAMEKALENWSTSIAVSNSALPGLLKFSPKIEMSDISQQLKESNNCDPTSAPFCIFSPALSREDAAVSEKEKASWKQEPSAESRSLSVQQIDKKENPLESQSHCVDLLLDSDVLALSSESQSLQPVDIQQPNTKHPLVSCSSRDRVASLSKPEFGSDERIAQQNLIDMDMQQEKQDVGHVQRPISHILEMSFTRLEQPNLLDAEICQSKEIPVTFSHHDISLSASPSLTGLGFDAMSQQNINYDLPGNSYAHSKVSPSQVTAYGVQKRQESMGVVNDLNVTSTTTSHDLSLLERFDGFDVHVEAYKRAEKPSTNDNRGGTGAQLVVPQLSQMSSGLDQLGDLLGGSSTSGFGIMGAPEQYPYQPQSSGLAHITPNEEFEKAPSHTPTDIFLDLLTSPEPPSLAISLGISSSYTPSSKSPAQNVSRVGPDTYDANPFTVPSLSFEKTSIKADSVKTIANQRKHETVVEQDGSFSFSAGQQVEIEKPEKVAEENHYVEKEVDKLDRVDFDVGEVEEYKSVHASLLEEAHSNNSPITASAAELEAIARGLQIIRNSDLEERRELGSGTFGTVYHGKWRGSDVAIKRIKASCFAGSPSEQERLKADFWREACILAQLHHPNVVAFYGVVPDGPGGTLATVTEYMVNGSLKQVLRKNDRALDKRKRLLIAMDTTFGMEYLHGKNIVHFDLKCDNLLVNMRDPQRPICKVGDLGLSKVKHQTLVSGGVRGTLPWMAPELLNGNSSKVCEKVDVFSFGIVMWELLTGEEPYADLHYGAIIGGIVNNTLRPTVPKWCDPGWRSLMERCWSADPNVRPSFTEIAYELRAMSTQPTKAQGQNQV